MITLSSELETDHFAICRKNIKKHAPAEENASNEEKVLFKIMGGTLLRKFSK